MATKKTPKPAAASAPTRPSDTGKTPRAQSTPGFSGGFPVVAIGASAGGLEAFEQFFAAMPATSGMAFVVLQHLDPTHSSILTEILQRSTSMPVAEALDQVDVKPNHVYVIPPNREMGITHGVLNVSLPKKPRGLHMPIDSFFRSLAEDKAEFSVGIVLSGTGSDGTLGLRAIHGAGGLCLVQDPATAKYNGMPGSAIQAGFATQVLAVEAMPRALEADARLRHLLEQSRADGDVGKGLSQILARLRNATGHDFAQYKKSTLGRRIERRIVQHGLSDVPSYERYLKAHPDELQALFRELLINVTSFFRDPQVFEYLKQEVLRPLVAAATEGDTLRIWVAGCATGEEAYSLAILLRELQDEERHSVKIQIYSTDIDPEAIAAGRAGVYPPNIAQDVSPDRLRRFFAKEDKGYRVCKEVREMVVFALQSVIKDPPFTRLDLLCCRNLLIYLEPSLQDRLMPTFHYALKPGGVLCLSPSESIGNHLDMFDPIERKFNIYRAKHSLTSRRTLLNSRVAWAPDSAAPGAGARPRQTPGTRRGRPGAARPAAVFRPRFGADRHARKHSLCARRDREIPEPGARPAVQQHHRHGARCPAARAARSAAPGAGRGPAGCHARSQPHHRHGRANGAPRCTHPARPGSRPETAADQLPGGGAARGPQGVAQVRHPTASLDAKRIDDLERELRLSKQSMGAMVEEQQASNEELQSTNEELQSTNEELQSTNEELETSKEELQSVNEELITVNSELQNKVELLTNMQDDMKNLLDNISVGTIFLDRHLLIRRFTRDATRIYRLVSTDVGRPLADIRGDLLEVDLAVRRARRCSTR